MGTDARARTRVEVRELDRRTAEDFAYDTILLMENAGRACAGAAETFLAAESGEPTLVFCGPGNNGGDGLVIARTLHNRGRAVRVIAPGGAARLDTASTDVRRNAAWVRGVGLEIDEALDADALAALQPSMDASPLLVDALFGTGLARPIEGHLAEVVRAIDEARAPVLAVDLPSGLDADTGEVLGAAARAALTVTLGCEKPGLATGRGPELCGRVVVAEIGIPRPLLE